jgi:hypothetical protein
MVQTSWRRTGCFPRKHDASAFAKASAVSLGAEILPSDLRDQLRAA